MCTNGALANMKDRNIGSSILIYSHDHPEKYGVIEYDGKGNIVGIEEKPSKAKSMSIITGMYFFDEEVVSYAKDLKPSSRGELEITDLLKIYLKNQRLHYELLDPFNMNEISWFDTGNAEDLLEAAKEIQRYDFEKGIKFGVYEIAAFEKGYINKSSLEKIAEQFIDSNYGKFIKNYLKNSK